MRTEILLLLCFLARRQNGTVCRTADSNMLQAALWSEPQYVCTEHLTSRSGREVILVETSTRLT